jgi:hypothetical protein
MVVFETEPDQVVGWTGKNPPKASVSKATGKGKAKARTK